MMSPLHHFQRLQCEISNHMISAHSTSQRPSECLECVVFIVNSLLRAFLLGAHIQYEHVFCISVLANNEGLFH